MTMKPSNFTMNSDYLSIAQTGRNTYTLTIGAGSIVVGGYTEQNFDFTTTAQTGSVDRILISKDGGNFMLGSTMTLIPTWTGDYSNNVAGFLSVYRTAGTNLRAQLVLENYGNNTATYPAMAFTIRVSSFKPPNIF